MRKDLILPIVALVILAGILVVGTAYTNPRPIKPGGGGKVAERSNKLPPGPQTYQIVSSENVWPKFVEATIDPLDVKPGDIQKMKVVLHDTSEIIKVVAEIETDNGIIKVDLVRTDQAAVSEKDFENQRYLVKDGKLLISDIGRKTSDLADGLLSRQAEAAALQKFVYEGQWTVRDTHVKTYHTVFRAEDASGRKNSITLSWTDPCNAPATGNWTVNVSDSCTNTTSGIENGNIVVATGGTLTLTSSTIVWNPGYSIQLTGGSIAIGSGTQFRQAYLYYTDGDADTRAPNNTRSMDTVTSKSGFVRLASAASTSDCNDGNASVWQNLNGYRDQDADTFTTGVNPICSGASLPSGYLSSPSTPLDCYDLNAAANPNQTAFFENDRGDGSFDYDCDNTYTGLYLEEFCDVHGQQDCGVGPHFDPASNPPGSGSCGPGGGGPLVDCYFIAGLCKPLDAGGQPLINQSCR